jgi:carbamoyl-phosphate synthase large subunit
MALKVEKVNKVQEGGKTIVDLMQDGKVDLVINTTEGEKSIQDSFSIRRSAIVMKIPYTTTASGAKEIVKALKELNSKETLEVNPIQSYN